MTAALVLSLVAAMQLVACVWSIIRCAAAADGERWGWAAAFGALGLVSAALFVAVLP